jgi:WhiB family redox-sensing transcriptional regulator
MDPEFFMVDQGKTQVQEAKNVCAGCPVRADCLNFYLEHALFDDKVVAGGMTHRERLKIKAYA